MPIKAGKLNRRVEFQRQTEPRAVNDYNEPSNDGWKTFALAWAADGSKSGRELWQAQQVQADITHVLTIRYRTDLNPKMRCLLHERCAPGGKRTLNIESITDPEGQRVELQLNCKEEV